MANWYQDLTFSEKAVDFLIDWLTASDDAEVLKFAQVWSRPSGGHTRSQLTPKQISQIDRLFGNQYSTSQIAKQIGVSEHVVRNHLIRTNKIQPKAPKSSGRGMLADQELITKIKQLRSANNPQTGKPYTKQQLAAMLGVSYQTVDRVIAFHDRKTPADLMNYVAYSFWNRYHSGMEKYLANIPSNQRMQAINGFIDTLFQGPQERQYAKEALYQKLNLRNKMMEVDRNAPRQGPVAMPFMDRDSVGTPDMTNNITPDQALRPIAPSPQQNNAWQTRQRNQTTMINKYRQMGKWKAIERMVKEYDKGGSATAIARKYQMNYPNFVQILQEMGVYRPPQQKMGPPIQQPSPAQPQQPQAQTQAAQPAL